MRHGDIHGIDSEQSASQDHSVMLLFLFTIISFHPQLIDLFLSLKYLLSSIHSSLINILNSFKIAPEMKKNYKHEPFSINLNF